MIKGRPALKIVDATRREPGPGNLAEAKRAFIEEVIGTHERVLKRYLQRILPSAEDVEGVLQEVFLRLAGHENPQNIEGNFRAYLFQIARNLATDRFRRQRTRRVGDHVSFPADDLISHNPQPDTSSEDLERGARLKSVLRELPPKYRSVLIGHVVKEMTYPEIGEDLGISVKTVQRYMAYAVTHCKQRLRGIV